MKLVSLKQFSIKYDLTLIAPFSSSLSSSGIYLLIGKMRLMFWIGKDFFENYLDDQTFC